MKSGYGVANINKKTFMAHRVAYEVAKGPIPNGMVVLHNCDNLSCINPDHLWSGPHPGKPPRFSGTEHWRSKYPHLIKRGEDHPNALMSDEKIIQLRRDYVAGLDRETICLKYNITVDVMQDYTGGRRWRHLLGLEGSPTLEQLKVECAKRLRLNAKLSEEDVQQIRERIAAGESQSSLARQYGVSRSTIQYRIA